MIPSWIPVVKVDRLSRQPEKIDGLYYVGRVWNQDALYYATWFWWPFAKFEYWYYRHAYWLWQLGARLGFLVIDEGGYYVDSRWTWKFWTGLRY